MSTTKLTRERQPQGGLSPGPFAHQVKALDAQFRHRGADPVSVPWSVKICPSDAVERR